MLIIPSLKVYEFKIDSLFNESEKQKLCDYLIWEHNNNLKNNPFYRKRHFNFAITQCVDLVDRIYNVFLNTSHDLFGDFTLSENNKRTCWAYVTNVSDDPRSHHTSWHNHLRTSTINGVFYLSVPDKNTGKLLFGDDDFNEIMKYQPEENRLIIFPNYVNHNIDTSTISDKHRISINVEITCNEDIWNTSRVGVAI